MDNEWHLSEELGIAHMRIAELEAIARFLARRLSAKYDASTSHLKTVDDYIEWATECVREETKA